MIESGINWNFFFSGNAEIIDTNHIAKTLCAYSIYCDCFNISGAV